MYTWNELKYVRVSHIIQVTKYPQKLQKRRNTMSGRNPYERNIASSSSKPYEQTRQGDAKITSDSGSGSVRDDHKRYERAAKHAEEDRKASGVPPDHTRIAEITADLEKRSQQKYGQQEDWDHTAGPSQRQDKISSSSLTVEEGEIPYSDLQTYRTKDRPLSYKELRLQKEAEAAKQDITPSKLRRETEAAKQGKTPAKLRRERETETAEKKGMTKADLRREERERKEMGRVIIEEAERANLPTTITKEEEYNSGSDMKISDSESNL